MISIMRERYKKDVLTSKINSKKERKNIRKNIKTR